MSVCVNIATVYYYGLFHNLSFVVSFHINFFNKLYVQDIGFIPLVEIQSDYQKSNTVFSGV